MYNLNFGSFVDERSVPFMIEYPKEAEPGNEADQYDDLGHKIKIVSGAVEFITGYSEPIQELGALIPLKSSVIFQSGGTLTMSDRNLFTRNHNIPPKSRIRYKNMVYSVLEKTDWQDYSDISKYTCKAVTAFD